MNKVTIIKSCGMPYIMIVLINAFAFLNFNMSTVGMPVYASDIGSNGLAVGLVTTISAIAALLSRPFIGFLSIRINVYRILFSGLVFLSIAPVLLLIFKSIWIVYIVRCLQGIGWGLTSTASSSIIIMKSPPKNMSEGIGCAGAVSSIATAVAPTIAVYCFENYGVKIMLLAIIISTLSALLMVPMLDLKREIKSNSDKDEKFKLSNCIDMGAIIPAVFVFIVTLCYSPMVTFITSYSISVGLTNIYIYYICYATTTIFSRPLAGKYVDKYGYYKLGFISLVFMFLSTFLLSGLNNMLILCCSGLFAGIGTGVGMNTFQTMAVLQNKNQNKGRSMATFLFGFDLGMAVGASIAGALVGGIGARNMFRVYVIFAFVGIIVFILLYRLILRKTLIA